MELKPIAYIERHMRGTDFFILWFGASISIAEIYAGNILVPLGWAAGMAAILLGHAIGNVPLALGGLIGSDKGLPTMYLLRPTFGKNGSYLATVLNILQLIGWTAIMLIICGKAVQTLLNFTGAGSAQLWIVISGAVCTAWAMVGKSTFKWLQRLSIITLGALCAVMTVMLFLESGSVQVGGGGGEPSLLTFGQGLDLCIAMPISWLPLVADYSRFARTKKGSFIGTYLGYFIGSSWMFALGLASGLILDKPEPIISFATLWFGVPALVIVLFSTFTTTFLDIYSSAVSALNLSPRIRGSVFTAVAGGLGIAVALVLPIERYEEFLYTLGSFFIPLFGVVLTHYFFLDYDIESRKKIDWIALITWLLGVAFYQFCLRTGFIMGASLPALIGTGLLFFLLKRIAGVRRG